MISCVSQANTHETCGLLLVLFVSIFVENLCNSTAIGPGLHPESIVMPARYLFLNLSNIGLNQHTDLNAEDLQVEFKGISEYGQCRVWVNKLDRKDGTFIIRYKLYQPCKDATLHIYFKNKHIEGSPFTFSGTIFPESCHCPVDNIETWLTKYQCPTSYKQIEKDLKIFKNVNIEIMERRIWAQYDNPRSVSICNYVIKNNEIYRKCFGEHVGFNMFSDNILLSLSRKVVLPDVEFFMNLGDWPLSRKIWKEPMPIFSWCGSDETFDIVMPTYELTQATLENMGGVMLDMLSVQGNSEKKWHEKIEKGFWRGRDSRLERLKLIEIAKQNPNLLNASITNYFFFRDKQEEYGKGDLVSFFKFFDYKYQVNIDGTVAAYRLPYLLAGDSVVFKQDSPYYEHFYHQLEPYEHYIPIKRDLSDLIEKLLWAKSNDEKVKQIAMNARMFANENLLPKDVFCYHAVLLNEWSKQLISPVVIKEGMTKVEQSSEAYECECSHLNIAKEEL